ncbi:MAG: response regulator transcription factor [Candidatus Omnitrophica bacterium]|nr:response regulator transcription factor [Candidatus Omnitrophota bacterium]
MKNKILIVEDDKDISKMLEYNLLKEGYGVISSDNGETALDIADKDRPGLIILDLMLPGIGGLNVCKILKKTASTSSIPIIMLTAKSQESDKVAGLDAGADDYVTKPFSLKELMARVKAVERRAKERDIFPDTFRKNDLAVDFGRITVTVKDKPVELTAREFELLKALVKARGKVISRDELLDNIWGFGNSSRIETRTVDVHIRTLRKKLRNAKDLIITVKKFGYRFDYEV